jgi:hypothetical protein
MGEANGRANGAAVEGAIDAATRARIAERMKLADAALGRFIRAHPQIASEPALSMVDVVVLLCGHVESLIGVAQDLTERIATLEKRLGERRIVTPEEAIAEARRAT